MAEVRYRAFGEDRYTSGTTPTTYRYTGQRQESYINLYYYGARWYDPTLARFVQADTIQPNPSDPQQLNRFSYVSNNPLRYKDPTGHAAEAGWGGAGKPPEPPEEPCGGLSFAWEAIPDSTNPKSAALSEMSFDLTVVSTVISAAGIAAELLGGAIGGVLTGGNPAGIATGAIAGALAYSASPAGVAENLLGVASFALTAGADIAAGNSCFQRTERGFELGIGKDTLVSAGLTAIGFIPESIIDTGANVVGLGYASFRNSGLIPNGRAGVTFETCPYREGPGY